MTVLYDFHNKACYLYCCTYDLIAFAIGISFKFSRYTTQMFINGFYAGCENFDELPTENLSCISCEQNIIDENYLKNILVIHCLGGNTAVASYLESIGIYELAKKNKNVTSRLYLYDFDEKTLSSKAIHAKFYCCNTNERAEQIGFRWEGDQQWEASGKRLTIYVTNGNFYCKNTTESIKSPIYSVDKITSENLDCHLCKKVMLTNSQLQIMEKLVNTKPISAVKSYLNTITWTYSNYL